MDDIWVVTSLTLIGISLSLGAWLAIEKYIERRRRHKHAH